VWKPGTWVQAGQQLTEGSINPNRLLRSSAARARRSTSLGEINRCTAAQGVNINDKHIEVIIRQMTNKVRVVQTGDTDLLPGELVSRLAFQDINEEITRAGGSGRPPGRCCWLTKAALNTESFLSASSFQHTINVLAGGSDRGQGRTGCTVSRRT